MTKLNEQINSFNNEQKRIRLKNKIYEEFDPGSGLTLAACRIHASRMVAIPWRTGESHVGTLSLRRE